MEKEVFAEIFLRFINVLCFFVCIGNLFYLPFIFLDIKRVKPICHLNFWISMILLHLSFISFLISSFVINFGVLITPNPNTPKHNIPWFVIPGNYLGCFAAGLQLGSIALIFFERLFATFYYRTYEKSKKQILIIVASICVFLFSLLYCYLWNAGINFFINAGIFYVFDILTAFLICVLFKLNQRLRKLKNSSNIVLTHRYQIFENLRMIRFIFPMVVWGSLGLIAGGATTISLKLFGYWMLQNPVVIGCYYYTVLNIFVFIAYSHMLLRQSHKREHMVNCVKKFMHFGVKINPETVHRNTRRRNAFGDYVVNTNNTKKSEGDIHFGMLKNQW